MTKKLEDSPFHSAKEEVGYKKPREKKEGPQFTLAFTDPEFLLREELRPVRLQLELMRAELVLKDEKIDEAMVFFGSARLPSVEVAEQQLQDANAQLKKDPNNPEFQKQARVAKNIAENCSYLKEATKLASISSSDPHSDFVVVTGGGPSFMEAANRGAHEVNARSIALNMILPNEQDPNPYVTPELTFQFHYFAIRKMHFLMRAKALAAFPGGFGTMDELFEVLTLMQTKKIDQIPLLLFNEKFWRRFINFEALAEEGTVAEKDLKLIRYVETAEEAWEHITDFYDLGGKKR